MWRSQAGSKCKQFKNWNFVWFIKAGLGQNGEDIFSLLTGFKSRMFTGFKSKLFTGFKSKKIHQEMKTLYLKY